MHEKANYTIITAARTVGVFIFTVLRNATTHFRCGGRGAISPELDVSGMELLLLLLALVTKP